MKKLFMLALLCLSFVASKAAPAMIYNNTNCDITVCVSCYDQNCNLVNVCPPSIACITVPAGTFAPFPTCPQCQVPPWSLAYTVCWASTKCSGICVTVAPPPNPCFPPQAVLPQCQCQQAAVYFDSGGNLIIQ